MSPGKGLDTEVLNAAVGGAAIFKQLKEGDFLFRPGAVTRGLYFVEEGKLRMVRHTACGQEVTVHVARAGETLAEPSLFSPVYHCDCRADIDSRVTVFPKDILLRAMENDVRLALQVTEQLAHLVQSLRGQIEQRNIRSAKERIMQYLMLRQPSSGGPVVIDGTLKSFASEIGLTHEAVYRAFRELEEEGRILRSGREFGITR